MSELSVRFGRKVKELRKSINISQNELAERVGVSKDYIGLIERGLRSPSLQVIERIANSLGVAIKSLFDDPQSKVLK